MKMNRKQLMGINIDFHPGLYTLQDQEMTQLLKTFNTEQAVIFVSWAPPIFYQRGDSRFTLVGSHLSFGVMATYIKKRMEIQIITKDENVPALIKAFSDWDKKLYSALLAGDASSYAGASRPTLIKRMRLEKGQFCPFCKGTAALTAEDNWRSQVKDEQGGKLKCPQCEASVKVTAEELKKFQHYDLRSDQVESSRWVR